MSNVGLVVVSHSRALARAAVALAGEMAPGVTMTIAAGLDDDTFGTDATAIVEAITEADDGAGVVVLMDLGSAVLSAELALEFLDDDVRAAVMLCPAPLVEGLVAAAVTAAGGADAAAVVAEANGALAGKLSQLGGAVPDSPAAAAPSDGPTARITVINPHGLHARPAARLVAEAHRFDATIRARKAGTSSEWVAAESLSKLATLDVRCGDELELRASGPQAADALAALTALAARAFDEDPGPTAPPTARPVTTPTGAGPGLGLGPAHPLRRARVAVPDTPAADPATERRRLDAARDAVRAQLTAVRTRTARSVGPAEAAIFDAHLLLLDDAHLLGAADAGIDAGQSAAAAWAAATAEAAAEFAALPDPYLRARGQDVTAVGDQVLAALAGVGSTTAPVHGVLTAADLTPAEAAELDPADVQAVLLAFGNPSSHSAILLRAKGIPLVVGAGAGVLEIAEGTVVAVDGAAGTFVVNPDVQEQQDFRDRIAEQRTRRDEARARAGAPARTRDGVLVSVGANLGSVDDAHAAAANGADMAGLVRTEFLFLGRDRAPDVDEQVAVYRQIADALGGRRITLRTLDVGGDKPLPFLPVPAEANPFLGVRGIRLSLNHPELLTAQLTAMLTVARETPVSIMFPMITTLTELTAARRLLDAAVGTAAPTGLQVGIMVEVPAAALKAAALAAHVDFFSIGTNDLTQYALAADRDNDAVAAVGDSFDPAVLALIAATCRGAAGRVPVSVCGELAADPRATAVLTGLGVRTLSMAPPAIPGVKEEVRELTAGAAAELANAALRLESAAAVRSLLAARRD